MVSRLYVKGIAMRLRDKLGRYITDLRVSITDRCNYRCVYCRTGNQGAQYSELPFADYLRLVGVLMRAFRDDHLRKELETAKTPEAVLATFEKGETHLR